MWPAPGYSSGNVERYIREQRVVQSSGNGYFSEQRTVESFHREQRPVYGSHSQALSIGPPMQGSNFQQFGPAPTDQRSRYDFNTVGNPGPVTPIGHSDQYSSNPLQHFDALTLGGPSDPYGSRSTPRGNYGSAGPSTYGNPGQLTYGQCNDQSGLNPFGNIRSNPGIFTPRGNSVCIHSAQHIA
ncbi:uncharacterized protein LOC132715130 [Ruditapes philippinarum]|uniref:uncharacterized protein LOC132715130 n=1 Tax=Ruditapes philippinarum TaxID=129788 RepID=UPI00295B232A|nr:uncharacterized protein LOC132715130 [Ruditapes philippinarum]